MMDYSVASMIRRRQVDGLPSPERKEAAERVSAFLDALIATDLSRSLATGQRAHVRVADLWATVYGTADADQRESVTHFMVDVVSHGNDEDPDLLFPGRPDDQRDRLTFRDLLVLLEEAPATPGPWPTNPPRDEGGIAVGDVVTRLGPGGTRALCLVLGFPEARKNGIPQVRVRRQDGHTATIPG